jgi:hypothetical protein
VGLAGAQEVLCTVGDVNFDGIATAFEAEIYGSSKGRIRLAVLWDDLLAAVPAVAAGGLSVLDAGGGAGHMAVRLTRTGQDPSRRHPGIGWGADRRVFRRDHLSCGAGVAR